MAAAVRPAPTARRERSRSSACTILTCRSIAVTRILADSGALVESLAWSYAHGLLAEISQLALSACNRGAAEYCRYFSRLLVINQASIRCREAGELLQTREWSTRRHAKDQPKGHLEKCRSLVAYLTETHLLPRVKLSQSPRAWQFFEVPSF